MSRMIDQLLDLTRVRLAGGIPIEPTSVDLGVLCQDIATEAADPTRPVRQTMCGDREQAAVCM